MSNIAALDCGVQGLIPIPKMALSEGRSAVLQQLRQLGERALRAFFGVRRGVTAPVTLLAVRDRSAKSLGFSIATNLWGFRISPQTGAHRVDQGVDQSK